MKINKEVTGKAILFIVLIYLPIFLHLDTIPIRIWDESRLAINAYEMHKDGNFLVTHFLGQPDMWNTKPPLMIWLQVFFIKIFGVNELAIRLPSAIAAFLTCLALLFFSLKHLRDYWFGLIAALILVTSQGYINVHVSRTGDYDALLTFFTTVFCFSFFLFITTNTVKYLHLFFIALTLAVLTKSVQGLFFMPALLVYSLLEKKLMLLIKNKWLWIDMAMCISVIAVYYLLRECYNPGYLQVVLENDLWGRYARVSDEHKGDFWFYYQNFIAFQFSLWYWLIPCGIALGLTIKNQQIKALALFSTLMGGTYFLVTSLSSTKLDWYDAPLYPFLSVIGALAIYWLFSFIKNSKHVIQQFTINVAPLVFLFFVFLVPYMKIIDKVYKPREYPWDEQYYFISRYLQDAIQTKHDLNNKSICYDGYPAQLLFYVNILNDMGRRVDIVDWHTLRAGSTVVISQEEIKKCIEQKYLFEPVESYYSIYTYKIIGERP